MAVVVVGFNSAAVIDACLRSAMQASPAEIVVVDNASCDATCALVARYAPSVRLLAQAENTGFAAGCNLGVQQTTAPFVLFLNDDAQLLPGSLATLVAAVAATPAAASATGKLLRPGPPGTAPIIDSAGLRLDRYALRPTDRGQGEVDRGQYDQPQAVFGPSGAAALYRRAALQPADAPFDARLFAYYEDVDLAWRLGAAGWTHLYVPAARILHGRRGPQQKPRKLAARAFVNRYRTWWRNDSWRSFLLHAPIALPWEAARLLRLGARQPRLLRAIAAEIFRRR